MHLSSVLSWILACSLLDESVYSLQHVSACTRSINAGSPGNLKRSSCGAWISCWFPQYHLDPSSTYRSYRSYRLQTSFGIACFQSQIWCCSLPGSITNSPQVMADSWNWFSSKDACLQLIVLVSMCLNFARQCILACRPDFLDRFWSQ